MIKLSEEDAKWLIDTAYKGVRVEDEERLDQLAAYVDNSSQEIAYIIEGVFNNNPVYLVFRDKDFNAVKSVFRFLVNNSKDTFPSVRKELICRYDLRVQCGNTDRVLARIINSFLDEIDATIDNVFDKLKDKDILKKNVH